MKLLFDENLSPKLVNVLASEFPDSNHVELLNLQGSTDTTLWELAKQQGYIIVSKDNDFRQRAFLLGSPPKVIWLSIGNAGTGEIVQILKKNISTIQSFESESEESLLILEQEKKDDKTI
jgi:predicted nuclease of predicted toxin-antitoxin system